MGPPAVNGFLAAAAFLTRIPMPRRAHDPNLIPAAVPWFPVVGAGIGAAVGGLVRIGVLAGLPPLAAAGVGAAAGLAVTGALHEDGLADTFDGLGSGRSGQRMLEIMADPRLGAFGTSALVVSILLQVSALAALAVLPGAAVVTAAAAAHSSSRAWAALAFALPRAAADGLAARYGEQVGRWQRALRFTAGIIIAGVLLRADAWMILPSGAAGALTALWAVKRLGGITGDILGAVQQAALAALLLTAAALWTGSS